jgi:hypothetical protein
VYLGSYFVPRRLAVLVAVLVVVAVGAGAFLILRGGSEQTASPVPASSTTSTVPVRTVPLTPAQKNSPQLVGGQVQSQSCVKNVCRLTPLAKTPVVIQGKRFKKTVTTSGSGLFVVHLKPGLYAFIVTRPQGRGFALLTVRPGNTSSGTKVTIIVHKI